MVDALRGSGKVKVPTNQTPGLEREEVKPKVQETDRAPPLPSAYVPPQTIPNLTPAKTNSDWLGVDEATRTRELVADELELKQAPLRRDVGGLGRLLGETIKEQCGEPLFEAVEEIRRLAIKQRDQQDATLVGVRALQAGSPFERLSTLLEQKPTA